MGYCVQMNITLLDVFNCAYRMVIADRQFTTLVEKYRP